MKTPHKHAELIKAWADGAEIEYRTCPENPWELILDPGWDGRGEYRIKPEPKPDVVKYVQTWVDVKGPNLTVFFSDVFVKCTISNLNLTFDGETGKLKAAEMLS
jgi:hypothetical protein